VTAARVIEEEALERRAPLLEYSHEPAARDVFSGVLFQRESQSDPVQRGLTTAGMNPSRFPSVASFLRGRGRNLQAGTWRS
jgi:hypothetical protein